MPSSTRQGKEEASLSRMGSRQSKSNAAVKPRHQDDDPGLQSDNDQMILRPADILIRDCGTAVGEEESLQARMSLAQSPLAGYTPQSTIENNLRGLTCIVFYESWLCS